MVSQRSVVSQKSVLSQRRSQRQETQVFNECFLVFVCLHETFSFFALFKTFFLLYQKRVQLPCYNMRNVHTDKDGQTGKGMTWKALNDDQVQVSLVSSLVHSLVHSLAKNRRSLSSFCGSSSLDHVFLKSVLILCRRISFDFILKRRRTRHAAYLFESILLEKPP